MNVYDRWLEFSRRLEARELETLAKIPGLSEAAQAAIATAIRERDISHE